MSFDSKNINAAEIFNDAATGKIVADAKAEIFKRNNFFDIINKDTLPRLTIKKYNPFAVKNVPSRVICEKDYIDILSAIIQRDFYPNLRKLRLQKAFLNAKTDHTFEHKNLKRYTDFSPQICDNYPSKRVKLLDGREMELDINNLSLQEFQALFTSEDNFSFQKLVMREKEKLLQEQEWIEATTLTYNDSNNRNKFMTTAGEISAQLITSNFVARAPLTFPITESNCAVMEIHRSAKKELVAISVEGDSKNYRDGSICCKNTELNGANQKLNALSHENNELDNKTQKRLLSEELIEKGVFSASKLLKHINLKNVKQLKNARAEHSNLNTSFEFVHTPLLTAGINVSPIMTWGSLSTKPHKLENHKIAMTEASEFDTGPQFQIQDLSNKEAAAIKLADTFAKKILDKNIKRASCLKKLMTPILNAKYSNTFYEKRLRNTPQNLKKLELPCHKLSFLKN